jgi:hypothetical protein
MTTTECSPLDSLSTVVSALDEIDAADLSQLPESVTELLSYINLHCRHVVNEAGR